MIAMIKRRTYFSKMIDPVKNNKTKFIDQPRQVICESDKQILTLTITDPTPENPEGLQTFTYEDKIKNGTNLPYVIHKQFVNIPVVKISMVYVLELEDNKFYIGFSKDVNHRLYQHFSGNGSIWTKLHKPVGLVECVIGDLDVEKSKTLEYMAKYGYENVRGSSWCKETLKSLLYNTNL